MKKDLEYLQHFNHKFAQWEPKVCLQKALVNNNFIFFRSRGGAVSSNPHNRHVTKVSSSHGVNMTLLNGRLSEDSDDSDEFDVESGDEDSEDRPWRPSHTIFGKSTIKQSHVDATRGRLLRRYWRVCLKILVTVTVMMRKVGVKIPRIDP